MLGRTKIESTVRYLGIEGAARPAPPDQSTRQGGEHDGGEGGEAEDGAGEEGVVLQAQDQVEQAAEDGEHGGHGEAAWAAVEGLGEVEGEDGGAAHLTNGGIKATSGTLPRCQREAEKAPPSKPTVIRCSDYQIDTSAQPPRADT